YVFNLGDGQDQITDNAQSYRDYADSDANFRDELRFGAGIRPEDVKAVKDGNDLIFQVGSGGDSVRVKNWFADKAYWIEKIVFASGVEWDSTWVMKALSPCSDGNDLYNTPNGVVSKEIHGLEGNDTLNGGYLADSLYGDAGQDLLNGNDGNDSLYGGDGNDTLNGGNGNDLLEGGDGDDVLNGESGADTLRGGVGNDKLTTDWWSWGNTFEGGAGNDTMDGSYAKDVYVFNLGDGQDQITDNA
ncbi:calcium-binding protein, partial [Chromobacterium vaccinii]